MIEIEALNKSYNGRFVLKNINLRVKRAETVALIGPSGSGKTTLIRTMNGFVVPENGIVQVGGRRINYKEKEHLREMRKRIGVIYQLFNLVERRSVIANVMSGALGRLDSGLKLLSSTIGFFKREEKKKAMELLGFVGIEEKAYERVDHLSGGQKQRVAIARALMQEPALILADEPVANLDPKSSRKILELLIEINREKGITLITVLHDMDFVKNNFKRVVAIKEGAICFDGRSEALTQDELNYIYGFDQQVRCGSQA